jgi:hypothetical protein
MKKGGDRWKGWTDLHDLVIVLSGLESVAWAKSLNLANLIGSLASKQVCTFDCRFGVKADLRQFYGVFFDATG